MFPLLVDAYTAYAYLLVRYPACKVPQVESIFSGKNYCPYKQGLLLNLIDLSV